MAVSAKLYAKSMSAMFNKEVGWLTGSVKCALCGSSYSPNQDTHDYFNDISDEVTGTGYTASGLTLTASTLYTASTNTQMFDGSDAVWTSSSIDARYAVLYYTSSACSGSISPLLAYIDFGEVMHSQGGAFTVTWSSAGIISACTAS